MKRKTVIIIALLIVILSLSAYLIINAINKGTPADENKDEIPPTSEGGTIITSERRDGPTPNGGDYSEIFYFDDDGNSVDKTEATKAVVKEYKNDGTVINEIFADINR